MLRIERSIGIGLLVVGCTAVQGTAVPMPTAPGPSASMTAAMTPGPAVATPMPTWTTPTPATTPVPATATPEPTPATTPVPATATPEPASTDPTPTPTPGLDCPSSPVLTVRAFLDADPTCFGGADVSIRAWADTPFATGWEAPFIEPAWLAYPPDGISMLWGVPPTGEEHLCATDDPACGALFVHVRSGSGMTLGDTPAWVLITGHVRDAAAETCHYVVGDDWPGEPPDDKGARAECRGNFVLTGVSPAPD